MHIETSTLIEIRKSPRKMQRRYLTENNVLSYLDEMVPNPNFSIKEKLDIVIYGDYRKCSHVDCNSLAKHNSQWCSSKCMNSDVNNPHRVKLSAIQTANSKERLAKSKQTYLKKYGVEHNSQLGSVIEKRKNTMSLYWDQVKEQTFRNYGLNRNDFLDHSKLKQLCSENSLTTLSSDHFGGMPMMTILRHFDAIDFDPGYTPGSSSMGEREIFNFVSDLLPNETIEQNKRIYLDGKEIDVFVPSKQLGIEYHGLYWHSEKALRRKNNNTAISTHSNKLNIARNETITLLQFYADEWDFKRDIVKSIIASKLGIYQQRIAARKCTLFKPTATEAQTFFDNTHLQGWAIGSYYGLKYDNEIIAMIAVATNRFSKDKHKELIRFSCKLNTQIIGGLSKLISAAKRQMQIDTIYSYSDNRYSSGNCYGLIGKFIRETKPGYFWVNNQSTKRLNRFTTQKHKLSKLLKDYNPAETEQENMERAGYHRIWDCGQKLFALT